MKVIVAGSRTIHSLALVAKAIQESGFKVTELVSGCAPGVDRQGEAWADERRVRVKRFPAAWKVLGHRPWPATPTPWWPSGMARARARST